MCGYYCTCYLCMKKLGVNVIHKFTTIDPEKEKAVDLSKARAGQIAHFRCGGSAKIGFISGTKNKIGIGFDGLTTAFYLNGRYGEDQTPWDIIRLEDPPFDWSTVKMGMCFEDPNKIHNRMWFIGKDPKHPDAMLFSEGDYRYNDLGETCKRLVRRPEFDIVVNP